MASTVNTWDFALKERASSDRVENMIGNDRPLLGMIPRDTDYSGEALGVPVILGNPQGVAASTRAQSQANATNVKGVKFLVTNGRYHGTVEIGDEVIKASRNNPGAYLENKGAEMDGIMEQMLDTLATHAWGNGGGALGVIGSISTDTITLAEPSDIINFHVGMEIATSENDGSAAAHTLQAGTATVTAVNAAAGTFTCAAGEIAAMTGEDAGDYIFRVGDFSGDTGVPILKGMQYQIPGTATPGALYGVTRTSDPVRLAGCYVPTAELAGKDIEQRITMLGTWMSGRFRTKVPSKGFLHPENWQDLQSTLQSQGTRSLTDTSTKFGYEYLEMVLAGKRQRIYSDPFCPRDNYFALELDMWKLTSMDALIHPLNGDGLTLLRKSTTDDYEFRLIGYPAQYTRAPVRQGRVGL